MPFKAHPSIAFILSLLALLFFPSFHLLFFAPYLIISLYRYPLVDALWRAIGCGIAIDLLSSSPLFGQTALIYCIATLLLHPQRLNFFEDKLSTLPLMTTLFSLLSTIMQALLLFVLGHSIGLHWPMVVTDFIAMPLVDGLYAMLLFTLPFQIYRYLSKIIVHGYQRKKNRG
ncbi:MAG: hypothetical protein K1000chlam4_01062 [Chlamydiae bacterium]|nr:hypothetical protein [Chlamydiota bacterium]